MSTPRVVIVGGGLAGMATAWALSRFPLQVTLLESRRQTGGRAGSFHDSQSNRDVDYCQHVAMGCCTNFLWWMRECELLDQFSRERELTFFAPESATTKLAASRRLPAPLHFATSLGKLRFLTASQRSEVRRGMWRLMRTPTKSVRCSMADWLASAGQSRGTVDRFWDVVLVSALGEGSASVAFAPARKVFVDGFLAAKTAGDVWMPRRPLAELFGDTLPGRLAERGVGVHQSKAAKELLFADNRLVGVRTSDSGSVEGVTELSADRVVLAVPWYALPSLLSGNSAASAVKHVDRIAELATSPISGVHLWFDRTITDRRHSVLVGGLGQWLFWPESATRDTDEHYYQVVISASRNLKGTESDGIVHTLLAELRTHFPKARDAKLLRSRIVTDPRAVFSVSNETETIRPSQTTEHPQLFLAGDYTQTGWPATMEGAVRSGFLAADAVLRSTGLGEFELQADLKSGWLSRLLIRD